MTKMNPVVHFEMPYENRERLVKFFTEAFGWQMQKLGKDTGDYVRLCKNYFFIMSSLPNKTRFFI